MQKITTFLWFDNNLEEAIEFYVSIFPDAKVASIQRNGDHAFLGRFELAGQEFFALNGGPDHPFTEAISLYIDCADQAEVDDYWGKLMAGGGHPDACGWLKDRFGLSWQVIPRRLTELLSDPDPARAQRAMAAMMDMVKIDVAELERAANG